MQRSALCRSRRELSNANYLQKLALIQPRTSPVKFATVAAAGAAVGRAEEVRGLHVHQERQALRFSPAGGSPRRESQNAEDHAPFAQSESILLHQTFDGENCMFTSSTPDKCVFTDGKRGSPSSISETRSAALKEGVPRGPWPPPLPASRTSPLRTRMSNNE